MLCDKSFDDVTLEICIGKVQIGHQGIVRIRKTPQLIATPEVEGAIAFLKHENIIHENSISPGLLT